MTKNADWIDLIKDSITINQLGILNCSVCHVENQGRCSVPPSAVLKSQLLVVLGNNKGF